MKALIGFLVCLVMLVCPAYLAADTSKVIDSACRVTAVGQGSVGTGCVFNVTSDVVQILTAAHVVGTKVDGAVDCVFYHRGYPSGAVRGKVVWGVRASGGSPRDVAVVEVPIQAMGGIIPPVIPLAPPDREICTGETIQSCGCPAGSWPNAFKGHVLNADTAATKIYPRPAQGRSGSAMINEDGTQILGVIIWQSGDNDTPCGYAVSIQEIHRAMQGQPIQISTVVNTRVICLGSGLEVIRCATNEAQCGPQGCPGGDSKVCPGIRPLQRLRQDQSQPPTQPWEGLPESYKSEPAPPIPSTPLPPSVPDLSEQVNSNTARIGSLEETVTDHQKRITNLEQDETPGVGIIVLSAIGVGLLAIVAAVCIFYGLFSN